MSNVPGGTVATSVGGSSLPTNATSSDNSLTLRKTPTHAAKASSTPSKDSKASSSSHPPAKNAPSTRTVWGNIKIWKFELIAAVFAIVLLVCEMILFAHYNHKFVFPHHLGLGFTATWPFNFKINAVFALLTAFIEAAMSFYIAACIGQLRWHWFRRKPHRLAWLDIMTNARGTAGAMRMLVKWGTLRQFATFGAVLVLSLLFMGTFTQLAINIVQRPYPPEGYASYGRVPIQTAYDSWYQGPGSVGTIVPLASMMAAIQSGFYSITNVQNKNSAASIASCGGPQCTFGRYQSIAVCEKCSQNALPVKLVNGSYHLSNLPDINLSLSSPNGTLNITADMQYPISSDLKSVVGPLIVRMLAIAQNGNSTATVLGSECAAWWCVATYSSNMINGMLNEVKESTWTNQSSAAQTTGSSQQSEIVLYPPNCPVDNNTAAAPPSCNYWIALESHLAIQSYLSTPVSNILGAPFLRGWATSSGSGNQAFYIPSSLPVDAVLQISSGSYNYTAALMQAFQFMTQYMTVDMRTTITADAQYPGWVNGLGFDHQAAFEVEWGWLACPIAVLVLSLLFLVSTIILNRHDEIWKSSTLAMMYHSFSEEDRKKLGDLNTYEAMKDRTRDQKVQLERDGDDASAQWMFKTKSGSADKNAELKEEAEEVISKIFGHGIEIAPEILDAARN